MKKKNQKKKSKKKNIDLYNKSKKVISILGNSPLVYNNNIKYVDDTLGNIKKKLSLFH